MNKEEMLESIVKLEYQMFERLKTDNEECKKKNTFFLMRRGRFYPLSEKTLESYIHDLEMGILHHQNFFMVKYRCIELGSFIEDDVLNNIVNTELQWMKELKKRYPHIIENKTEDFERYLRCELSTFSRETLESYYRDILKMKEENLNMAEISYLYLFNHLGYKTLEEVENSRK